MGTVLSVTSDVVVSSASSDTQDIVSEVVAPESLPEAVGEIKDKQEAEPTSGNQAEIVEDSTTLGAPKQEAVIADEPVSEAPTPEPVPSEPIVPTKETKPDTLEN